MMAVRYLLCSFESASTPLPHSSAMTARIHASTERNLTTAHDLDEIVDLFAISRSSTRSQSMTEKVATLPLKEAVVLVIEEWADDKFRQLSAITHRRSGEIIRSLEEIRDLYDQATATRCCARGAR